MARKILVYDFSSVAQELLRHLRFKHEHIVLVAQNEEQMSAAQHNGFDPVLSDLTNDDNLRAIGVGRDVTDFFCVTDDDNVNLYVTLSARSLSSDINILARASNANAKRKLILAGANETIDFNEIGANRIFHLLKRPIALDAVDSIVYRHGRSVRYVGIQIVELTVHEKSFIKGHPFHRNIIKNKFDVIILGIKPKQQKGRFIFNAGLVGHTIAAGDIMVIIGHIEEIARFNRECMGENVENG